MSLTAGERLGPYEILAPIGAGGMGEVWKARDARLDRLVALKVSKTEFSERFEREARAIAALNHSNICTLYDVGPNYLVMEYIEGTPLLTKEKPGPLPLDVVLKYAAQICDALDAAHKKGITHRDLKPGNILVTKSGIKLLDFGLAKLASSKSTKRPLAENDETLPLALTGKNEIVGTLFYMSPEQLQAQATGQEIDARSDIFSFGIVLYEMLTGTRAFGGSSPASVIAAIMERPAPSIADIAPPALDRLLQRCLSKDPDDRWQSARDLKAELDWIASASRESFTKPAPSASRLRWMGWAAAGVVAVIAAVLDLGYYRATRRLELKPLVRLDVDLGPDVSLSPLNDGNSSVVLSSDGTRLVYMAGNPPALFLRRLDQPKATELPGTPGAAAPFFSPDGQWVGFFVRSKPNKISVEGGPVIPLTDASFTADGASWGEDGGVVLPLGFGKGLGRISSAGGAPAVLTELGKGEIIHVFPQILPGGKAVLFVSIAKPGDADKDTIDVVTVADHRRKTLVRGGTSPRYLPSGHLLYTNKSTLFAIPFDLEKLETRGTAVPILDDVAFWVALGGGQYDVSRNGTLVYRKRGAGAASAQMTVQWVDTAGKSQPLLAKPAAYFNPRLSPDGKRLALAIEDGSARNIWVYDQARDAMTRLTSSRDDWPVWSPDGRYVIFESRGGGILWTRSDGAGQPQLLLRSKDHPLIPWSLTPDGKRLAYFELNSPQIWTVPLEDQGGQWKAGQPEQFLKSQFNDQNPAFSPDGRWLAYRSNESGKNEVYVRAFPPPASGQGGKWQISNSGGTFPVWSRDGRELLYQSGDQLMAVNYTVKGQAFEADKPRVWITKLGGTSATLYPDGRRVAVLSRVDSPNAPAQEHEVVLLQNFFDELHRKFR